MSVINGKWDYVLQQVELLMDLYEAVFYELLELRELYTANEMLTKCEPLVLMKREREERYEFGRGGK